MCIRFLATFAMVVSATGFAAPQTSEILNPTGTEYRQELVRLKEPAPPDTNDFLVRSKGQEVPHQIEEIDGTRWIWVVADFAPGERKSFEIVQGKPGNQAEPMVELRRDGESWILDNGFVAVRLPLKAEDTSIPGPLEGIRMNDKWIGSSEWRTSLPLKSYSTTVIGDGTLFAKVRLRYEFEGKVGPAGDQQPFSEIDVTLGPGWKHVEIAERHSMDREAAWSFDAAANWQPKEGRSQTYSSSGMGNSSEPIPPNRPLVSGARPFQDPDLFINLIPRWNQSHKDGWFFAATDGKDFLGAVVVRASQWVWPHDNAIEVMVKPSGDAVSFVAPTWHGQRLWWIFGPSMDPAAIDYVRRYAWEHLDKLNHEFVLEWPGKEGRFAGMNFYNGGQMNPTGGLRRDGRRRLEQAGKAGNYNDLITTQVMFHPDAFGTYTQFWSPQNANFFTDFIQKPIAITANLKDHPQFEQIRAVAEAKLREDIDHSVTLPGGAGQECPGYQAYGLKTWAEIAEVTREHLGFDPMTWERVKASEYFLKRISQPDGDSRRMLPIGDTHPQSAKDGGGGPKIVEVSAEEVSKFETEELPGFGVIFNNRPGTSRESYLSFKSGPNRGHYHGDQLSIHYAANAKALAVDHHASYNPRPGQEHMHNRVSFHTKELPFANMDGYERVIAFKTGPEVDIAIGQVESDRLREMAPLPPENWDQRFPRKEFEGPLKYRRTVVFVKGDPQDYVVLRDQYWAPEDLFATYNLHVRSDQIKQFGQRVDFGNLTLFCAHPAKFDFVELPWSHKNGGGESTEGARLTIEGTDGEFITVLYPGNQPPNMAAIPGGVRVGDDEITFAGSEDPDKDMPIVTVRRKGHEVASLLGSDIDLNRFQGDIGLFVPDAGYPFGEIPDWLIQQRAMRTGE